MNYDVAALNTVRETRLLIDRYDAWLFDEFRRYVGQRVLEIGCGLGNLLQHFADRDLVVGIEPEADVVQKASQRLTNFPNIHVFDQSITEASALSLSHYKFDTAVTLNVFEHIEDDMLALRHVHELLQPDGVFIIMVPAHQWLYGTMDRSIGHYRRYTKETLRTKLSEVGFQVISQKYINTVGALGWWFNGRVLRRPVPPAGQLQVFNPIVPIIRAVETSIPPPFGMTVMTIARRAGVVNAD